MPNPNFKKAVDAVIADYPGASLAGMLRISNALTAFHTCVGGPEDIANLRGLAALMEYEANVKGLVQAS